MLDQNLSTLEFYIVLQLLRSKRLRYVKLLDFHLLTRFLVKFTRLKRFYSVRSKCKITLRRRGVLRLTNTSRFFTKKAVELTIFPGITRASW